MGYTFAQFMNEESLLRVSVLLFAVLRDALGRDEIEVSIPLAAGSTPDVAALLSACAAQHPKISSWLPHIRVAVNQEYSSSDTLLHQGDEIAFIPPVAGG